MIRFLLTVLICTTAASLFANESEVRQDLFSMSVNCPEQVTVGDRFIVEYHLTYPNDLSEKNLNISLTPISEIASLLTDIPSTAKSITTNIINGKINKITSTKWYFTFRANKTGVFTTPPFTITDGNDTLPIASTNKLIEITKDNDKTVNPDYVENKIDTTQVITRLEIDKNSIQLGDSLKLRIVLLSNSGGISSFTYTDTPMIEDCYMEVLANSSPEPSEEVIDQCTYNKWIVAEYMTIPLKRGTFQIGPLRFEGEKMIWDYLNDSSRGILPRSKNVPFETQSNSIIFNVE